MDIVLEAKNLTKVYGSGEGTVHALRGVSVGIERGSFTAIIGKSGCGQIHTFAGPWRAGRTHERTGTA